MNKVESRFVNNPRKHISSIPILETGPSEKPPEKLGRGILVYETKTVYFLVWGVSPSIFPGVGSSKFTRVMIINRKKHLEI